MCSGRVNQLHFLNRNAESRDVADGVTPRAALELISPVGSCVTLAIAAILKEESRALCNVTRILGTEGEIAYGAVAIQVATSLDDNPSVLFSVNDNVVLGVAVGIVVTHLADTRLARTISGDGAIELYTEVLLVLG